MSVDSGIGIFFSLVTDILRSRKQGALAALDRISRAIPPGRFDHELSRMSPQVAISKVGLMAIGIQGAFCAPSRWSGSSKTRQKETVHSLPETGTGGAKQFHALGGASLAGSEVVTEATPVASQTGTPQNAIWNGSEVTLEIPGGFRSLQNAGLNMREQPGIR